MSFCKAEKCVVQFLDAGYNLARWLLGDAIEAEDAVQDACVSALRHMNDVRGTNIKAWFLTIVRNNCRDRLRGRSRYTHTEFDERRRLVNGATEAMNPEDAVLADERARRVRADLLRLPAHLREVLVLRELEELKYLEIAAVLGLSKGTVMSRLSRARARLLDVSGHLTTAQTGEVRRR